MTMNYSNRSLDFSSIMPANTADVNSTAGEGLQPIPSTATITPADQDNYAKKHNELRENYLRNQQASILDPRARYSLTSTPEAYKQIQQDVQELQNALQFDLDKFLSSQTQKGVSENDALVAAKEQIMLRVGIMACYNTNQIYKQQAFAMLNGTADAQTRDAVMERVTFFSNAELSPMLNLEAQQKAGTGFISPQSAENDTKRFKEMLQNYLNTTYRTHLDGIPSSANYFQPSSGGDVNRWGGDMSEFFKFISDIQGGRFGYVSADPSNPSASQQSVSSGNMATDIINQAAAISEAKGGLEAAQRALRTKYGINDIADAEGWKKLAGGRPINYSEELYAALFKDSAAGGKAIPKDKDEIKSLLAGNTLSANVRPMVQAYAELQADTTKTATLTKLNDALSLAYTVTHLTKELNAATPNFQQRFESFRKEYSTNEKLRTLDTTEAGQNAITRLSAQLIRDLDRSNAAPDVVPASGHDAIKAFAKDLGIAGFDQDISGLTDKQVAELTRKAEVLVKAAEYIRLKNNPNSNAGSISAEQLEALKKAVGIDPALLDKVAEKYKKETAILHLGDLCSPGMFALAAGTALQKK